MGRVRQWWDRRRGRSAPELQLDASDLVIVAEAFDPAEADSSVLARSDALLTAEPAVLRHHLELPPGAVGEARRLLDQDHWDVREQLADQRKSSDVVLVTARRVQHLDALHCAQERSRMAGLAQRLGGDALGWDALQPRAGQDRQPAERYR